MTTLKKGTCFVLSSKKSQDAANKVTESHLSQKAASLHFYLMFACRGIGWLDSLSNYLGKRMNVAWIKSGTVSHRGFHTQHLFVTEGVHITH